MRQVGPTPFVAFSNVDDHVPGNSRDHSTCALRFSLVVAGGRNFGIPLQFLGALNKRTFLLFLSFLLFGRDPIGVFDASVTGGELLVHEDHHGLLVAIPCCGKEWCDSCPVGHEGVSAARQQGGERGSTISNTAVRSVENDVAVIHINSREIHFEFAMIQKHHERSSVADRRKEHSNVHAIHVWRVDVHRVLQDQASKNFCFQRICSSDSNDNEGNVVNPLPRFVPTYGR
mmetsp:Transcript_16849/g.43809  ORF Transcript_16849/g.43809 Transcript_16849/m.43809 type:complete len:230 (+) Transcript_16849:1251-1940(+)